MQKTADTATGTLRTADGAIKRVETDASGALHHADALLIDARQQLDGRAGELSRLLRAATGTVGQADTFVQSLNRLMDARSPFRDDLEGTMRDLAAAASSLRDFAATVEGNPNALLLGRSNR